MHSALEQVRRSLNIASEALALRDQLTRTLEQRDTDLGEAMRAHRYAKKILNLLRLRPDVDHSIVAAIAALEHEVTDLGMLLSQIRFDEEEDTERIPLEWHAEE